MTQREAKPKPEDDNLFSGVADPRDKNTILGSATSAGLQIMDGKIEIEMPMPKLMFGDDGNPKRDNDGKIMLVEPFSQGVHGQHVVIDVLVVQHLIVLAQTEPDAVVVFLALLESTQFAGRRLRNWGVEAVQRKDGKWLVQVQPDQRVGKGHATLRVPRSTVTPADGDAGRLAELAVPDASMVIWATRRTTKLAGWQAPDEEFINTLYQSLPESWTEARVNAALDILARCGLVAWDERSKPTLNPPLCLQAPAAVRGSACRMPSARTIQSSVVEFSASVAEANGRALATLQGKPAKGLSRAQRMEKRALNAEANNIEKDERIAELEAMLARVAIEPEADPDSRYEKKETVG